MLEHSDAHIDINSLEAPSKRTALHWAAKNGKASVASLLVKNGADATLRDGNGETALSLSGQNWSKDSHSRHEELILEFIDLDPLTAIHSSQLMASAAIRGSVKVIEKLIELGADPTKHDEHGW